MDGLGGVYGITGITICIGLVNLCMPGRGREDSSELQLAGRQAGEAVGGYVWGATGIIVGLWSLRSRKVDQLLPHSTTTGKEIQLPLVLVYSLTSPLSLSLFFCLLFLESLSFPSFSLTLTHPPYYYASSPASCLLACPFFTHTLTCGFLHFSTKPRHPITILAPNLPVSSRSLPQSAA